MSADHVIHLSFSQAEEIPAGLDRAVSTLIDTAAQEARCGILVTRNEPGSYTVALDESVPFGQTHEVIGNNFLLPKSAPHSPPASL